MFTHLTGRLNALGRWLKFNLVEAMGIPTQLGGLHFLTSRLGVNYLPASALAVEAAALNNFVWLEHVTWADRAGQAGHSLGRLLGFNSVRQWSGQPNLWIGKSGKSGDP